MFSTARAIWFATSLRKAASDSEYRSGVALFRFSVPMLFFPVMSGAIKKDRTPSARRRSSVGNCRSVSRSAKEGLLVCERPSRVALAGRPRQADRVLPDGQGRLQKREAQDVLSRIVKEDRDPVEGNDTAEGLGNSVEQRRLRQVRDNGVVDFEQRAVALRGCRDRRVERRDFLVRLHVFRSEGDLVCGLLEEGGVGLGVLVRARAGYREDANGL